MIGMFTSGLTKVKDSKIMSNHGKPRRHRRDSTDLPDQQQNVQSSVNNQCLLHTPQQPVQYMLVPVPVTPTGQYQEQSPILPQFYQHSPIPAQYFAHQLPSDQYLQPPLLPQASGTSGYLSSRVQKTSKGNLNIAEDDTDDDHNRPQLHGFARSDNTQAEIPDVDDIDVFKFIIKTFGGGCTYNDFSRKCDLFEDKLGIPRWFSKHTRRFKIYRDGSKVVYISPFYHDMKICAFYNKQFGNCNNTSCDFFHVCRKFVWGHCKNRDCKLSHSFKTTENRQLKEKLGITDFTDTDIKVVLNANSPSVCYDYLYNEGCKIPNSEKRCPYLHLCRDHVFKKCKTPCKHKMTHSIKQYHNNWVLTSCRMQNWPEQRVLKSIYVPPSQREQLDDSKESDLSFDVYDEDDIGLSSDYVDSEADIVIQKENGQEFGHHLIRSVENISSHSDAAKPQKDRKVDRMSRFKSSDNLLQRDDQKFERAPVARDLGFRDVPKSKPTLEHYNVDTKREANETGRLIMRYGHMDAETQIPSSRHYIDDGKTKEKEHLVVRRRYSAMETQQPSGHFMNNTQNKGPTHLLISRGHTDTETRRSVLGHYDDDKNIKEKERLMMRYGHMDAETRRLSAKHYIDDKDTKENEHVMNRLGYIDTETKRPVVMHSHDFPKAEEEGRLRNMVRRKYMDTETCQTALVHYDGDFKTKERDRLMVRREYIDTKAHQPTSGHYGVGVENRTTEKERGMIMPMDQLKQKQRVDSESCRNDDLLQPDPDILHCHNRTGQNTKETERLLIEQWKMQQRVLGKTSGRPLQKQTPMFKREVIKSDCEDNDQALLKDESNVKNICIFVLREMCSSTICTSYHLSSGTPYLWQLQMFGKWVPFASSENEIIEIRFCNLHDSVNVKIVNDNMKFRYLVHFDNTMYGIILNVDGQPIIDDHKCAIRRLSTPAYAEEPSQPPGSYATHWKWYFRDNAHTWTIYDKDIQLTLEVTYLFGEKTHSFIHDNFKYTINFETMTQLNRNTKRTRQITRRPLFVSNVDVVLKKFFSKDTRPTPEIPRQITPDYYGF